MQQTSSIDCCMTPAGALIVGLCGFSLGFLGAIPVAGPITALVFGRALEGHRIEALRVGTGAAVAEGIYAALAFGGLAALAESYPWIPRAADVATAMVLAGLGGYFLRNSEASSASSAPPQASPREGIAVGFAITILNPTLIGTWAAASTMVLALDVVHFAPSLGLAFGLGVSVGIVIWFTIVVTWVDHWRRRVRPITVTRMTRLVGWSLLGLSLGFAWRAVT